jgi:hypothetical protein
MKKVFLALILSVSSSFAYTWSGETVDGINMAFQQYDMFIQQQNEKLKQKYISKKPLYKEILQNHKDKELHLRHITILNVDSSLDKGSVNFGYEKFKQLKNKQGDE